jgi:hypothetical protein
MTRWPARTPSRCWSIRSAESASSCLSWLRFRGIEANQLGWSHRCAAVNLKRLLRLGLGYDNGWTLTEQV